MYHDEKEAKQFTLLQHEMWFVDNTGCQDSISPIAAFHKFTTSCSDRNPASSGDHNSLLHISIWTESDKCGLSCPVQEYDGRNSYIASFCKANAEDSLVCTVHEYRELGFSRVYDRWQGRICNKGDTNFAVSDECEIAH